MSIPNGKWFLPVSVACFVILLTAEAQPLSIGVSNQMAAVKWPLTNYYSILQTSTNLTGSNSWSNLGSAAPDSVVFSGTGTLLTNGYATNHFSFMQPAGNSQQFFRIKSPTPVPVFSYAIFYDGLLEFSDSGTLMLNGNIHANGPVYTGPAAGDSQIFNGTVTTTNTISSPANAGIVSAGWSPQIYFKGTPPFVTNIPPLLPYYFTNNGHSLIDIPPATEPATSAGQSRYYNQAQMILLITNTFQIGTPRVRLLLQSAYNGVLPGGDPTPLIFDITNATPAFLRTNPVIQLPFLALTNTFTDQREFQSNPSVTQIDMGRLASWIATNVWIAGKYTGGSYPTILFVADRRTNNFCVVRLVNASKLPYNNGLGFTIATPDPLYVLGNYNTTIDGNNYALTLGSTTNGEAVPAALIADAITILSPNWNDNLSGEFYTNSIAASMTMNAALIAGDVPSTGTSSTTFSGGVHNLPRLLENWSGATLTLNTSLVRLYASQTATNTYRLPSASNPYYSPPTRNWGLDINFYNPLKLPPGTPVYLQP